MNYRFMIDTAVYVIRKRYDKRHNPVAGDTVCVVCAGNGNIYTASNEYIKKDEYSENVHAEIIALRKMQEENQTRVQAVTVFNSCFTTPLLPCDDCIAYILALNPENINTLVVTPNGNIRITDVSRFAAGHDYSQVRSASGPYSVYTDIPEHNRGASLYTNPSGGFTGAPVNHHYGFYQSPVPERGPVPYNPAVNMSDMKPVSMASPAAMNMKPVSMASPAAMNMKPLNAGSPAAMNMKPLNAASPVAMNMKSLNTASPAAMNMKSLDAVSPAAMNMKSVNKASPVSMDVKPVGTVPPAAQADSAEKPAVPVIHANQNGVNNLLKNKLSTLFNDDDDE